MVRKTRSADRSDVIIAKHEVKAGQTQKQKASAKGTYADLLTNLLVYDNIDKCPGRRYAVLAGHKVLKGHLR